MKGAAARLRDKRIDRAAARARARELRPKKSAARLMYEWKLEQMKLKQLKEKNERS